MKEKEKMSQKLKVSSQIIQDILKEVQVECEVLELPSSTRTAAEAAKSIGCEISQIVKSLIFKTKKTGKPVLILVSGANKVNEKKIEQQIGEEVVKADADFTRDVTGFVIGGIPPIGLKEFIPFTFFDAALLNFQEVWAAAGTPNAVFGINSHELLALTRGKLIQIQ